MSGRSRSKEDFLKAVYSLQQVSDRVSTNALADTLGIAAPSVTDMARRMENDGMVEYWNNGQPWCEKMHKALTIELSMDNGYFLWTIKSKMEHNLLQLNHSLFHWGKNSRTAPHLTFLSFSNRFRAFLMFFFALSCVGSSFSVISHSFMAP